MEEVTIVGQGRHKISGSITIPKRTLRAFGKQPGDKLYIDFADLLQRSINHEREYKLMEQHKTPRSTQPAEAVEEQTWQTHQAPQGPNLRIK